MRPRRRRSELGWRARVLRHVAASVGVALPVVVVEACVIADPPTELPQIAERRPTIVRASVVPSTTSVLGSWPSKFIVPVELSNPNATIEWATFVDYNPVTGDGFDQTGASSYEPASTKGNIRTLELPISVPPSDRCHVVEVIVARDLNTNDIRNAHTTDGEGDSVSWFYSPSGDLAGCPVLDAGLVPLLDAEAGVDADVDGGGGGI